MPKGGAYSSVVIWLHGLGDTAMGWAPAMPALNLPSTKIILPTASELPISINGGFEMPAWFDLYGLSPDSPEDVEGFAESSNRISKLIENEVSQGIPRSRIAVCGFSQGGALALHLSLRYGELAGCAALSAWLPLRADYPGALSNYAKNLKVIQCHGTSDLVVPCEWGRSSFESLEQVLGVKGATWYEYRGMAHSACDEELSDVSNFLQKIFKS